MNRTGLFVVLMILVSCLLCGCFSDIMIIPNNDSIGEPQKFESDGFANNGYTDIAPQTKDGSWFYERTSATSYAQSYCYKGSDSFWIVQFLCRPADAELLEDIFYLWVQSVEMK